MPKTPSSSLLPFLAVERTGTAGIGEQIYCTLRQAIEGGVLRSGFRLPSSRQLAKQAGVGRNSVHYAYQRLAIEGFLRSRSGSGTYVIGAGVSSRTTHSRVSLSRWATQHIAQSRPLSTHQPFAPAGAADQSLSPRWLQLVSAGWREWRNSATEQTGRELPELRRALCEHAAVLSGVSCSPDEIIVGTGGDQLIMAVARLVADSGDAALVDDSSDRALRFLLQLLGLKCIEAPLDDEGLDVERISGTSVRVALLRPSAEGPRGIVMSAGRRYAVMAWAKAHATPLIEDDFDSIIEPATQRFKSLKSLDTRGVCIHVVDLSRVLLPGVMISYAIAPRDIVEAYRAARMIQTNPPTPGEQLALAAFLRGNDFTRQIARMRSVYSERKEALTTELVAQLGGAIVSIERRGPLQLIARLAHDYRDVAIVDAAASLNLEIAPLSAEDPGEQGLILGYGGVPPEKIPAAVSLLGEAFAAAGPAMLRSAIF